MSETPTAGRWCLTHGCLWGEHDPKDDDGAHRTVGPDDPRHGMRLSVTGGDAVEGGETLPKDTQ